MGKKAKGNLHKRWYVTVDRVYGHALSSNRMAGSFPPPPPTGDIYHYVAKTILLRTYTVLRASLESLRLSSDFNC